MNPYRKQQNDSSPRPTKRTILELRTGNCNEHLNRQIHYNTGALLILRSEFRADAWNVDLFGLLTLAFQWKRLSVHQRGGDAPVRSLYNVFTTLYICHTHEDAWEQTRRDHSHRWHACWVPMGSAWRRCSLRHRWKINTELVERYQTLAVPAVLLTQQPKEWKARSRITLTKSTGARTTIHSCIASICPCSLAFNSSTQKRAR